MEKNGLLFPSHPQLPSNQNFSPAPFTRQQLAVTKQVSPSPHP
jgi:hypothetical protein